MPKVNLKTIAGELGVSISTVSKALQDSHEIGVDTKERVLSLAKKLNFQPNPYASSLRRNQTRNIAVIIPEIANNFFALAINGIESVAREKNYHVLIYLTHDEYLKEVAICEYLQNGRIDGVLISTTTETQAYEHLVRLTEKGVLMVLFDRVLHEVETAKVTTDDFVSSLNATEHLIQNGCRNIAYLSLSSHLSIDNKRKGGYLEALHKYDIPFNPDLIVQCGNNEERAQQRIRELLSSPQKLDGIFASVEKLAIETYLVCQELAISIPQDLKIICFSNLKIANLLNPPLSTVTQPAFEIGREAANVLFRNLDHKRVNIANENIVLKSTLIPRLSTQKLG
jgi:LacI family transcriptional regulator